MKQVSAVYWRPQGSTIQGSGHAAFVLFLGTMVHDHIPLLPLRFAGSQVCHKRNIHNRTLEDTQRMANEWESAPAVYPHLDVSSLYTKIQGGSIREVEMEEDSDVEERDAQRKQPHKCKGKQMEVAEKPLAISRWELMDDRENEHQDEQAEKPVNTRRLGAAEAAPAAGPSCELQEVIKRAQKKRVRWADEEEEVDGFHIGGGKRQLEEVHILEGLGPQIENSESVTDSGGCNQQSTHKTFAELVKAEHMAFKSMRLKGVLKGTLGQKS